VGETGRIERPGPNVDAAGVNHLPPASLRRCGPIRTEIAGFAFGHVPRTGVMQRSGFLKL
jgi:hypothetical protein